MTGDGLALFAIAYDVADDRRRRRVAALLEHNAARVQESLFEVMLTAAAAKTLQARIEHLLEAGDLLRVYPVREADIAGIAHYGGAPPQRGADYWLL
jgi:CRISPR-associated protein Cas2